MVRARLLYPVAQVTEQGLQGDQFDTTQSTGKLLLAQGLVSSIVPEHATAPLPEGWTSTFLLRLICSAGLFWHFAASQIVHSELLQFTTGTTQWAFGQLFVSCSNPVHGVPQALFSFAIDRRRLQSSMQPPMYSHSFQSPNSQF
jgi:hypothetical protein